jgi:hypothetical protein
MAARPCSQRWYQISIGSLKYTHHLGLNRFAILREQLILQESVMHSINELPLLPLGSVLGAALRAAGDKFGGRICFGSQEPPYRS